MKISWVGFVGANHSWSMCAQNLSRQFKSLGNQVDMFATDGKEYIPNDLKDNLKGFSELNDPNLFKEIDRVMDKNYDMQISYTSMKNFPYYLNRGKFNRFGIWCFEWAGKNVLPDGFAKNYQYCDEILAPSAFAKKIFLDSGIPENNIKVIPHGIDVSSFKKTSTIKLNTNKKFKILANIAQNHLRKNIPGLLESYGKAFTNKDDVCLVLKCSDKPITNTFDVSIKDELNKFYNKYPKHGEILLFKEFITDISDLYRSVDATFTMSHAECFYFPGLESIAAGKLAISPNYGGQLDFLNETNSLLISGKEERADPKSIYWQAKPNAIWFKPSIDDAIDKLRFAYNNYEVLNSKIDKEYIYNNYSWNKIAKDIIGLCV